MLTAKCTECDAAITIDEGAVEGEILQCPECSVELELLSVAPPRVDLAPEVEEDWGE